MSEHLKPPLADAVLAVLRDRPEAWRFSEVVMLVLERRPRAQTRGIKRALMYLAAVGAVEVEPASDPRNVLYRCAGGEAGAMSS